MLDKDNPNVIIAGFDQSGYYSRTAISSDYGVTWRNLKRGRSLNDDSTDTFSVDDAPDINTLSTFIVSGCLYSASGGEIFRGTNYGVTTMEEVLVLPTDVKWIFEGSLYAATESGLYSLNLSNIDIAKPYEGSQIKAYNFPNPFNPKTQGGTVIRVSFPSHVGTLKLKIYTLSGDLVTEETFNNITGAYSYAFIWDGRNQQGDLCAPGMYFLVGDADGKKVRHKIVLIR